MVENKTRDALEIMDKRHPPTPTDVELRAEFQQQLEVAALIHDARTQAGLTRAQLAQNIGVAESVIEDLEEAQYEGHTMLMLRRIAESLGLRIQISFLPRQEAA